MFITNYMISWNYWGLRQQFLYHIQYVCEYEIKIDLLNATKNCIESLKCLLTLIGLLSWYSEECYLCRNSLMNPRISYLPAFSERFPKNLQSFFPIQMDLVFALLLHFSLCIQLPWLISQQLEDSTSKQDKYLLSNQTHKW